MLNRWEQPNQLLIRDEIDFWNSGRLVAYSEANRTHPRLGGVGMYAGDGFADETAGILLRAVNPKWIIRFNWRMIKCS
jgi:hypothetical protein